MPSNVVEARETTPVNGSQEQLLVAVGDLIVERGMIGVSLSEIAQRSGVNSALIKYYFGNKSGLLMALLERSMKPGLKQLEFLLNLPVSAKDKLRIHISGIVNTYHQYPFINPLMHHLLADGGPKYEAIIAEELVKPIARAQKAILEEGVALGIFKPVDPMMFYYHLVGACDHFFHARFSLKHVFGVQSISEELRRDYAAYLYNNVLNGMLQKD